MDFDDSNEEEDPFVYRASRTSETNVSSHNYSDSAFWEEFVRFQVTWYKLLAIYGPLEVTVLSLGLIGNVLAFATLLRSRNLNTPTFLYHRVLVFADLLFCLNYFFNLIIERTMTVADGEQFDFVNWLSAFYSGIVYHAVHTTCSYIILYMTMLIAFERFIALLLYRQYSIFNRFVVARMICLICIFLSTVVHSWAPWFQQQVIEVARNSGNNHLVAYTWIKRQRINENFVYIKDIYNVVIRIAYPVIVSLLTSGVIYGFVKRQRHITDRYSRSPSLTTGQQRSRYEKTLFLFMIAVIILAFVQIGAAEGRRILKLLYPPDVVQIEKVMNVQLDEAERLYYFRILLYGFQVSRIVSNLCTAINHSFVCYLYMIMNHLFRRELSALLCCKPAAPSGLLRPRGNSSSASSYGYKIIFRSDPDRKESQVSRLFVNMDGNGERKDSTCSRRKSSF